MAPYDRRRWQRGLCQRRSHRRHDQWSSSIIMVICLCLFVSLQSTCCWVCIWPPHRVWPSALQRGSNGHSAHRSAAVICRRHPEYSQRFITTSACHCSNGRVRRKRSHSVVRRWQQCSAVKVQSVLVAAAWRQLSSHTVHHCSVPGDFATAVFRSCAYRRNCYRRHTSAFHSRLRTMLHDPPGAAFTAGSTTTGILPSSRWLLCHIFSAINTRRAARSFIAIGYCHHPLSPH